MGVIPKTDSKIEDRGSLSNKIFGRQLVVHLGKKGKKMSAKEQSLDHSYDYDLVQKIEVQATLKFCDKLAPVCLFLFCLLLFAKWIFSYVPNVTLQACVCVVCCYLVVIFQSVTPGVRGVFKCNALT